MENFTSDNSNPGQGPVNIPDEIKVYNIFNQFFIRWANQETKYAKLSPDEIPPLDIEQGIYFFEPFEGILVIRSTKEFEKFLTELACGKKAGKDFQKLGLYLEMVVLFWHLFVSQIWRLDTRVIKPAILKKSIPADWPDRKADSGCTVFIKSFALEIRLWANLTAEEKNPWKKTS